MIQDEDGEDGDITTEEALKHFEGQEPMSKELFSQPVYGPGFRGDVPLGADTATTEPPAEAAP